MNSFFNTTPYNDPQDNGCIYQFTVDSLVVKVYATRPDMGAAAASAVGAKIREFLSEQQFITIAFAAAPSQNEFLEALSKEPGIDWKRVTVFQLDEYVGLPEEAPQRFARYLEDHIINLVRPGKVHYINGNASSLQEECRRYSELIKTNTIDIACIGIGENAHIAFNDPPVADFNDPKMVKVVELDRECRMQQVHDGCFSSLEEVPTHAITMTVPTIMSARWLYGIVPGPTKSTAVKKTLEGEISTACPASILRTHDNAILFLDMDAVKDLNIKEFIQD